MRALLLRPPRRGRLDSSLAVPPLGLCCVAAALQAAGHEVALLDALAEDLGWDAVVARVARWKPELVGIGAPSALAGMAAEAGRRLRPHARWLLLGGPWASAEGGRALAAAPELDGCVEGEADESAPEALAWLAAGARGEPPPGLRVRDRGFHPRPPPADLDALPWPARGLLPRGVYRHPLVPRRPWATLVSSRGCAHACTFCDRSAGGRRWRARSAASLLEELAALEAGGLRWLHFYDDDFAHDRARVEALCEGLLARGTRLCWNCEVRADEVDGELLGLMRRAGCRLVALGVESAWEPSLRALGKGFGRIELERAFAAARGAGLRTLAYAILGAPGEGPAQVDATLRFCRHLGADFAQFSTLCALEGSALAGAAADLELPGPLDAGERRAVLSELSAAELRGWQRRAWAGFYLRPGPLLRLGDAALRGGAWRDFARVAAAAGLAAFRR